LAVRIVSCERRGFASQGSAAGVLDSALDVSRAAAAMGYAGDEPGGDGGTEQGS
jgi:hypothetical protein